MNTAHEPYMRRCLHLAACGRATVAPNPMVGALLVHEGSIIAEGFHQQYGGAHAEVNCINQALQKHPDKIAAATLYVSLEPCAHFGKTPPCSDLIIKHKIPRVVIGCRDSFQQVNGKGVALLKAAGIEVIENVLQPECIALNKSFFCANEQQRPYVILKWAQTVDGYIASHTGKRLLISNNYTNRLVHQWRSAATAIMIGANTALLDDPLLDARHWPVHTPIKVVIDPTLRLPPSLKLFNNGGTCIIFNTLKEASENNGIQYIKIKSGNGVHDVLAKLQALKIQRVLVEGGHTLLQSFIDAECWDEARIITNTLLTANEGLPAPLLRQQQFLKTLLLKNDRIDYFKNIHNTWV